VVKDNPSKGPQPRISPITSSSNKLISNKSSSSNKGSKISSKEGNVPLEGDVGSIHNHFKHLDHKEDTNVNLGPNSYSDNITPTFSFVVQNLNSGSSKANSISSRNRKRNLTANNKALQKEFDIIGLVDTRLHPNNKHEYHALNPRGTNIYNNRLDSKDRTAGGTALIISPYIKNNYNIIPYKLGDICNSHAQVVKFQPKNTDKNKRKQPFIVILLYLPTGANAHTKRVNILDNISSIIPNNIHAYCGGDFNFVEADEDTSSTSGKHAIPAHARLIWTNFIKHYKLVERHQPGHTFYRVPMGNDLDNLISSRLDRIYTSHTETDCALFSPVAYIPHTPYNILNVYLRANSLRSKNKNYGRKTKLIGAKNVPDHLPVGVRFASTAPSKRRGTNLPSWVASNPSLLSQIRVHWERRSARLNKKEHTAYDKLSLFKQTVVFTTTKYLSTNSNIKRNDDINELSIMTSLLRLLTATSLDMERVTAFLYRHQHLDQLITITNNDIKYNDLIDKMNILLKNAIPREHDDDLNNIDLMNDDNDNNIGNTCGAAPSAAKSHYTQLLQKLKLELPSNRKRMRFLQADNNSTITNKPLEMANIIKGFWSKVWEEREDAPTNKVLNKYFNNYNKHISITPKIPSIEIMTTNIKNTNNSCAGPDGIPFAFYRELIDISPKLLRDTLILLTTTDNPPPDNFNHARLFIIPKNTSILINNTRPISVTNTDNRIIAKSIAHSITPCLQDFLDEAQQGFVKERQGSKLIINIHDNYYKALDKKQQHYILFMDTRKAFDSIDHSFITHMLKHIGMPDWVINIITNLLSNVMVSPVVGENTNVHIKIKRGVKQGCPLSPLLFVLCYDILIFKMNDSISRLEANITIYAFADDLAIDSAKLPPLLSCMKLIDNFSSISGLGLNKDKTEILTTIPPNNDDNNALINSAWPDTGFTDNYKYLGVLMGSSISTLDIFLPVYDKFKERLDRYAPYIKSCSIQHRIIIINVFLISLFSYLALFFIIPYDQICIPIRELCRKHIIPYHGGGFGYVHLLEGRKNFGFNTPLKDLWAFSTALLIGLMNPQPHGGARWCLIDNMLHVHYAKWNSLNINEHRAHMLMHYLHNYGEHDDDGMIDTNNLSENVKIRRKTIYRNLVDKEYQSSRWSLSNNTSSIPYKLKKLNVNDPEKVAKYIMDHAHNMTNKLPAHIWHYQIRLTFNALPFDMRIRKVFKWTPTVEDADVPFPCHLCGIGPDAAPHVYGDCSVGLKAKKHFGLLSSPPRTAKKEFEHWLLGFEHVKKSEVNIKTIVLGWAIWCESRKGCYDTADEALKLVIDRTETTLSEILEVKKKNSKKSKKKEDSQRVNRENNFREIDQLLSSLPTTSTIIFTDGSASPNPGPSGAGIFVIAPTPPTIHNPNPPPLRYDIAVALGNGTNNRGEMWALGMANQAINELDRRVLRIKGDIHIFPDSKYAINNAEGTIKVSQDINLAHAVRKSTAKTRFNQKLIYHWVKGHNGIDGNERADAAADRGTRLSADGKGMTKTELNACIHNGTYYKGSLDDYLDYG